MPPKKKSTTNGKNGRKESQKRASVGSEGKEGVATPKSDESKSVDEYSEIGGDGGSRRGSNLEKAKDGVMPSGIDAEAQELEDMKARRQKLERTTSVLNKHDFVVQKLIMKAREDLVRHNHITKKSFIRFFRNVISFMLATLACRQIPIIEVCY